MLMNRFNLLKRLIQMYEDIEFWTEKDSDNYVPMKYGGIYKRSGTLIRVFDDVGNQVEVCKGFVPINGGTILYELN